MTPEQLRQWCREYDALAGRYPENEWEGWALWRYLTARLDGASAQDAEEGIYARDASGSNPQVPAPDWWLTDAEARAVDLNPD